MALKGKQKNIDMNKNNGIDAEDFALLKKKKEGKVMKAKRGRLTFDDKFKMQKEGVIDKKTGKLHPAHESFFKKTPRSKIEIMAKTGLNPDLAKPKPGPLITKKQIEKNLETTKKEARSFLERRKKLSGLPPIPRGGKIGAAAAAVAATAAGIKKFMEKRKEKKKKKMGGGLAAATEKLKAKGLRQGLLVRNTGRTGRPIPESKRKLIIERLKKTTRNIPKNIGTQSAIKKFVDSVKADVRDSVKTRRMGGGMMKRPMGYKTGMSIKGDNKRDIRKTESMIGASKSSPREKSIKKRMGGGMMMNKPMGYKSGKSIKVKCKLGRNKPTKMY